MEERDGVSEIKRHPLRPEGFEEPLFLGRAAKKEIAEHLEKSAAWLRKASEARTGGPTAGEPCHVLRRPDGSAYLVTVEPERPGCRRRRGPRARKQRVGGVIERWREVRGWWEPGGGGADRLCFRVLLGGSGASAVVDLALDRGLGWSLTGVWD